MRILKITVIVALVVVAALYGMTMVSQSFSGKNVAPVISCDDAVLEISVQDDESVLFQGVTASDAQDGDMTDTIRVAGISKFIGDATANVNYIVFDNDNNVGTLSRTVHFADYTEPRFEITEALNYKSNETIVLLDRLSVQDCIDGDITGSVRVSSLKSTEDEEIYTVDLTVTNSMGDICEVTVPIVWQIDNTDRPKVVLKSYLVYLELGSSFDARDYVSYVDTKAGVVGKSEVKISGNVDTDSAGTYMVHCSYTSDGVEGLSILTVVVE